MRIILPFLLLVLVPTVQAQAPPDSGARVRIASPQVPRGRLVGVLERFTGDTVVVAGQPISQASISRFEVSAGRKSQWLAGIGIGFAGGAVLGAVSGAIACHGNTYSFTPICAVALGAIGGGVGLVVGGIVGAITHDDEWHAVSLSTLRITPLLRYDGTLTVSIGLRF